MPAPLRRTHRRSVPAALFGALATAAVLAAAVPQAALAAQVPGDPASTTSGVLQGVLIAMVLVIAAGLAVLAQIERERVRSRGRDLARHRLQPTAKAHRAQVTRSRISDRRIVAR